MDNKVEKAAYPKTLECGEYLDALEKFENCALDKLRIDLTGLGVGGTGLSINSRFDRIAALQKLGIACAMSSGREQKIKADSDVLSTSHTPTK